jgi:Uma2 family endonuclease
MARIPPTKEMAETDRLVLNVESVGLSEEQFFRLCRDNSDLRFELTAQRELIIMPPAGFRSGWRNNRICYRLTQWAEKDGTGIVSESSGGYTLPNGANRAPDASWIRSQRFDSLSEDEQERFVHLCPDFVVELMSPSDRLQELQEKMDEYIANGAQLGWLIDPFNKCVYIYRAGQAVEYLENPTTISGDPTLAGFVFNVAEIW